MTRDIHDALASQFDTHSIVGRLHAVPPHEVYEVRVDGRRAVYKVDTGPTGNAGVEGRVLALVGAKTTVPVPEVLAVGDDHFVTAWHPDAPAPDASDGDGSETATGGRATADAAWARAAGRGLATLHDETEPLVEEYGRFGTDGPDPTDLTVDGSPDWHAAAMEYVRRHRPVLARHGHADVADAVLDCLADRPDAFAGAGGPVCCHGWATPEHVAVADGRVACLVDFEHAMAAPGEFDYWRTVFPTFGSSDDGNDADRDDRNADRDDGNADRDDGNADRDDGNAGRNGGNAGAADNSEDDPRRAFRAGYESVRPLPDGLDRRRPLYFLLAGVYYFESLYVQAQHDPDGTAEMATAFRQQVLATVERVS